MRFPWKAVAWLTLGVLMACAPGGEAGQRGMTAPDPADITALGNVREQLAGALNSADLARVASLFVEDAVFMPPNQPPIGERQAIQGAQKNFLDQVTTDISFSAEEMEIAGGWAFERGALTGRLIPKVEGEPIPVNNKYLRILERHPDGSWMVARDMINSAGPPSGGSEEEP